MSVEASEDTAKTREHLPWKYLLKRGWSEFNRDQCMDIAASLTYYSVLAIFPAAIAVVALLGVVGDPESTLDTALNVLSPLISEDLLATIEPVLEDITQSTAAGTALLIGVLGALWSASGYVGAFSRAMNRIYGVQEGRPFWILRPMMLAITMVCLALVGLLVVTLVLSGDIAASVAAEVGLGEEMLQFWQIAKWPLIALIAVLIVAVLYYATPNVKKAKFRLLSGGAVVAIVLWVLVSVGCAYYLNEIANFSKTYGSLAGVIGGLLSLWLANMALLVGAEVDAELTRARQLQAGLPAELEVQLPPRSDRGLKKSEHQREKFVTEGREIRNRAEPVATSGHKHLD